MLPQLRHNLAVGCAHFTISEARQDLGSCLAVWNHKAVCLQQQSVAALSSESALSAWPIQVALNQVAFSWNSTTSLVEMFACHTWAESALLPTLARFLAIETASERVSNRRCCTCSQMQDTCFRLRYLRSAIMISIAASLPILETAHKA